MVCRCLSLIFCLVLLVKSGAAQGPIQLRIRTVPAQSEVFSADGSQRFCDNAQEGFLFERSRLQVGKTRLSHLRVQIRHRGYQSHLESIPGEAIDATAEGGTLEWPPPGTVITLAPHAKPWTHYAAWFSLPLCLGAWILRRRTRNPEPKLMTETIPAGPQWELPTGSVVARYRVLERLGEGVSAVVYRVRGEHPPDLALKLLKPDHLRGQDVAPRFRREMKALTRLRHVNIPYLEDFGEHQGMLYLVMELLEGESLRQRLESQPVSTEEAWQWVTQLAGALAFAHRHGILHRDLKPENVMFGSDGKLRLTDFGLARAHDSTTLTVEGTLLGTPAYMAPEIVQGDPSSPSSDQYSLGCVAYELLTGKPPYQGESPLAVAVQHVHGALPELPSGSGIHPKMVKSILRMLAKDPGHRYVDLDGFLEDDLTATCRDLDPVSTNEPE